MAPKVKGVIFDMDGLMFDTERIWDTFWVPCCRKLGLPDPPQAFYSGGRGLAGDGLRAHIAEFYGSAAGELLEEVWRYGDEQFDRGVPCKPGLKELLEYLDELDMKFARFAELDFTEEFVYLEPVADDASDYMKEAVKYYHEAFKNDSYSEHNASYAQANYECAYKRLQIIMSCLRGEPVNTQTSSDDADK